MWDRYASSSVLALWMLAVLGCAEAGAETDSVAEACSGAPSVQEPVRWFPSINPQYPMRAAQRQIDGWVDLAITLRPNGGVERTEVCDSTERMFEKAALIAIRRWCYAPPAESDPEPFTLRVRFLLDDAQNQREPYFASPEELIVYPRIPVATNGEGPVYGVHSYDSCADSSETIGGSAP